MSQIHNNWSLERFINDNLHTSAEKGSREDTSWLINIFSGRLNQHINGDCRYERWLISINPC